MTLTPGKTIRKFCLDCVENSAEVKKCHGDKLCGGPCEFYRYRQGKKQPPDLTAGEFNRREC
jgi:sulfatase maturation enzyme AslB (radical SAM superfamily)